MARTSDRVQLHPRIPQKQCQRERQFYLSLSLPTTELDHGGPRSLTPSDEERVFLIRSHGLRLGGPCAVRVGLGGITLSSRFSRFSPTWGLTSFIGRFRCSCSPSRRFARSQLGVTCKRMGQRFPRRFRVYSPCYTFANFSRWFGPRHTRRSFRVSAFTL